MKFFLRSGMNVSVPLVWANLGLLAQRRFAPRPSGPAVEPELVEDEEYEPSRRRPAEGTP